MVKDEDIQILKRRYSLRDSGAEMRDMMDETSYIFNSSEERLSALDNVSNKMKGKDRLFFRQGFLFRAGMYNNHSGGSYA